MFNSHSKTLLGSVLGFSLMIILALFVSNNPTSDIRTVHHSQTKSGNEPLRWKRRGVKHTAPDMVASDPEVALRFKSLSGENIAHDDPELIQFIRDEVIEERRPFKPKMSRQLYMTPQAEEVSKVFKNMRDGFFVEAGGLDGERSSNTIWLEKKLNWKGFLVEMDPSYYIQLRGKNRQCYTANTCISPKKYPVIVPFSEHTMGQGAIAEEASSRTFDCMCFPFYSLMLALDQTHIDYFSLDVEGQEMNILKTIPFDLLDISVFSIEYSHTDKEAIVEFMESKGYRMEKKLAYLNVAMYQASYDYIFVKNNSGL